MIRGDGLGGFEGGRLEPPRQWEGGQGPGPSLWVSLTARGRQARHEEAYEPSKDDASEEESTEVLMPDEMPDAVGRGRSDGARTAESVWPSRS